MTIHTDMGERREDTTRAIWVGLGGAVVMLFANAYLAMMAGMTINASITAAVVALAVLKGVYKNGTIHECNLVQTMTSAGESLAAGAIFTIPALLLVGAWTDFDFWKTTLIVGSGGVLGVLAMVPLRRPFIADPDSPLKYPEGTACATVLTAATQRTGTLGKLGGAIGLGGGFKLLEQLGLMAPTLSGGTRIGGGLFAIGANVSAALVGVGFIIGLPIAVLVLIGGLIEWFIYIPLVTPETLNPEAGAFGNAMGIWSTKGRYLGVGAMVVGGIAAIWSVRGALGAAVRSVFHAGDALDPGRREDEEISMVFWRRALALTFAVVLGTYIWILEGFWFGLGAAIINVPTGFLFVAVSSYIVGLVGTTSNPVSGMTIFTVLITAVVMTLLGMTGEPAMVATLGVAGVVCCAAALAGDTSQDLKTGSIVGATPRVQQKFSLLAAGVASFAVAPVLSLLVNSYGLQGLEGAGENALQAPQAALMASLAKGFFGNEQLPWDIIMLGAGIGLALWVADSILERRKSSFRLYVMPVAVGLYLPIQLATPIFLGGLVAVLVSRVFAHLRDLSEEDRAGSGGVIWATGLIAGEALMAVVLAIPLVFGAELNLGFDSLQVPLAVLLLAGLVLSFFLVSRQDTKTDTQ